MTIKISVDPHLEKKVMRNLMRIFHHISIIDLTDGSFENKLAKLYIVIVFSWKKGSKNILFCHLFKTLPYN